MTRVLVELCAVWLLVALLCPRALAPAGVSPQLCRCQPQGLEWAVLAG